MSDNSRIEWTDATWGPVVGCTKVSPGCDNCYAETFVNRFAGKTPAFPNTFDRVTLRPEMLDRPLRWTRPRRIFVNSMSDLFHDDVPDEYIARVFAVMALTPRHSYQVLTKRHGRMRALLSRYPTFAIDVLEAARDLDPSCRDLNWPLPNVWLGVSVENQQWADIRIPALLNTPAAVRFLSCEPLLGPVDLRRFLRPRHCSQCGRSWDTAACGPTHALLADHPGIHWVIVGGESGQAARPMAADWARTLRDQCTAAGTAFHFKQWGQHDEHGIRHRSKHDAGRDLDGRNHDGYPVQAAAL